MAKLAGGFAEAGGRVDLVVANASGPLRGEVLPSVNLVDLGANRVRASLPGLVRYLRRERPSTLISAEGHANTVAVWARDLARVDTKVVVTERNNFPAGFCTHRGRLPGLSLLKNRAYARADAIVAVSSGVAANLREKCRLAPGRIRVIYNPVVTPGFEAHAQALVEHPWFAPGQPEKVILAVGRLTEQKDFPTLLRAFALLRKRRPARLMILGDGEERSSLTALADHLGITANVALPGFVTNPYPYMKGAGVFVLSSTYEGLPGVLIEALACGCPLVSTDCQSGPREILENGRWGRLVPVGDPVTLADAIDAVLTNPPPPPPPHVVDRFRPATVLQQYRAVIQACHAA
jgi:glycosyltransferase involved in cell wall biosynthesis